MQRRASLTGVELDQLMAEFDEIENDMVNLSNVLGLAYGLDWSGRGLRLAQLIRALKVKVADHVRRRGGYDQLCSDDCAVFQRAQDRRSCSPRTPSALEMTVRERSGRYPRFELRDYQNAAQPRTKSRQIS